MGCTPRPEYVLLRGLRRLRVFPGADVGAQVSSGASSASTRRSTDLTVQELVARWQPYAGVVDFHPLLDSLAQAGLVAAPEAISMWARALGSPNKQVLGMDLSAQLGQEPHPRGHVPIGQEARADLFVGCFAEPSPAPSSVTTGQRRPRGRARAGSPVDRGLARSSHAGDQQPAAERVSAARQRRRPQVTAASEAPAGGQQSSASRPSERSRRSTPAIRIIGSSRDRPRPGATSRRGFWCRGLAAR